jgi:hypothetical protein
MTARRFLRSKGLYVTALISDLNSPGGCYGLETLLNEYAKKIMIEKKQKLRCRKIGYANVHSDLRVNKHFTALEKLNMFIEEMGFKEQDILNIEYITNDHLRIYYFSNGNDGA